MSTPTPEPFATVSDLETFGIPVPADQEPRYEQLLAFASAVVRSAVPTVDARIDAGTLDPNLVKFVVLSMVARKAAGPQNDAVTQQAQTYGPFTTSQTMVAGLYLTARELKLLREGGPGQQAFTINPLANDTLVGSLPYWDAQYPQADQR